ncbi:MAG: hypothetical protein OEZ39_02205 [Gammaproteobacteria bacterium]|nr:hypothetical protein [Gammaproteobacteria bacterium]MDH5650667.1 hypothetical protein [Gammaproteobacteria bacterium]
MGSRMYVNGREVTNPAARWLIVAVGISFALAVSWAFIFIILPIIGLTLTFTLGLILAVFLGMLVFLPLLAAISVWLGLLSIPFQLARGMFRRK